MNRRHIGAGFWDFLIVVAILVVGLVVYRSFLMPKPAAISPPLVVQNVPAPAPVIAPTPVAAPVPVHAAAVSTPPTSQPSFRIAPPLPPPVPECKIMERDLRVAQEAAAVARTFIQEERKACLARLHRSPEYLDAKADVQAKKSAKEAIELKLRQDNDSGSDTDQDEADFKAASTDWITAAAKLTAMENDAIAGDSELSEMQAILASASSDALRLTRRLNDAVAKLIDASADDPDCAVRSVKLDTANLTLETQLAPSVQADCAAMADSAVIQIGKILKGVLSDSPFTWTTAKFTVFADYNGTPAVEFQARYQPSAVEKADFDRLDRGYFDDRGLLALADRIWLSPVVNEMQGQTPAMLAEARQETGQSWPAGQNSPGEKFDILLVGGYRRGDGSMCPLIAISRPHVERPASLAPIIPGRVPMPPSYSRSPMPGSIVNQLPGAMVPPD